MHKRYYIFIAVTIICAGFAAYFVGMATAKAAPRLATVTSQEITMNNVHLVYPQLDGLQSQAVQDHLNRVIFEDINAFAQQINKPDYSGQASYKVELNTNNILSITLNESYYVKHAAHPMSYLRARTMNTETGRVYQFADLFKSDADYKTVINQLISEQLADKQIFVFTPFKGIKDDQEFYLTPDSIVVYYQLYEYTPYAYGFLKFTIPYNKVANILEDEL